MPSFVCDTCQETLKKAKLDTHFQRCRNAQFSCIDCNKTFHGTQYRTHTTCITEAEKYQKSVYQPPRKHNQNEKIPCTPVSLVVLPEVLPPIPVAHVDVENLKERSNSLLTELSSINKPITLNELKKMWKSSAASKKLLKKLEKSITLCMVNNTMNFQFKE